MVRTFRVACSMVNRRLGDSCSTVRAYYGARVRGPKPRTGSKSAVERGMHRALYKVPRNLIFIRQICVQTICVHGTEYYKRCNKSLLRSPCNIEVLRICYEMTSKRCLHYDSEDFPQIQETSQNSRRQKRDMQQVLYRGPTILG